ncbi:UNVERIFIED_ORG: hypothetical protein [Escherichia phage CMSTMSU]
MPEPPKNEKYPPVKHLCGTRTRVTKGCTKVRPFFFKNGLTNTSCVCRMYVSYQF